MALTMKCAFAMMTLEFGANGILVGGR